MPDPRTYPARRLWHYVLALLLLAVLTWIVVSVLGHPRDAVRPVPRTTDAPATANAP